MIFFRVACFLYQKYTIWASSWDYGTYHIGDKRGLRQVYALAQSSAQSRQSLRCLHTWNMEVDEGSDQTQTSSPTGWLCMRIWRMSLRRTKSTIISWNGWYVLVGISLSKTMSYSILITILILWSLKDDHQISSNYFPESPALDTVDTQGAC